MNLKMQTDDHNCGVWVIWYATMWQTAYTTGTTIQEITQNTMKTKHITNFATAETTQNAKKANEKYIKAYRQKTKETILQ